MLLRRTCGEECLSGSENPEGDNIGIRLAVVFAGYLQLKRFAYTCNGGDPETRGGNHYVVILRIYDVGAVYED